MDEKMQMFRALLGSDEKIYYARNKVYEPIEENTARLLGNLKAKQDRIRNKALEEIELKIENKNLLNNKLLIVDITDILHKNLTGVVANKCAEKYKRPAMLLRFSDDGEFLTGSIRGYEKGYVKDFKSLLQKTGKFVFVEGHANAAGFKISPKNIVEVNDMINEQMKEVEVNIDLYEVDFILQAKQLKKQFIVEIDKHMDLWGQNVDEPLIAIKDIEVNKDEVYLNGKTSKSIKFIYNGIEFIKFFSNEEEWESIVNKGERLVIDVVGKCTVNEYKGERKPQIKIEDYEVTKVKKKQFVF
jgi:single-stranded-DNA-specific exonuclease